MNLAYREIAKKMVLAGVSAADPTQAVLSNIKLNGKRLTIMSKNWNLDNYDRILLFGIGKAVAPIASALEQIITPDDGLLITKIGDEIGEIEIESVPVYKAYHPQPREENVRYTRKIVEKVGALEPYSPTLIFFIITGGGSALFCAPPEGISVEDMFELNQLLIKCGADIYEINTIRKHLSCVKGGRFGQLCSSKGATTISLILSDVVGDDLSVIASGPTYRDSSTFKDAIKIAKCYKIWGHMPYSVKYFLLRGLKDSTLEPPREVPEGVHNFLVGNNITSLQAAEKTALDAGFKTMILTSQNSGEAREVAKCVMGIAREIQDSGFPLSAPAALIFGGEMTVTFDLGKTGGTGGPNREFVLSAALEVMNRHNIVIAAADTDGVDGKGKSGAIADCETVKRAGLNAREYLDKHDTQVFFDELGDSLNFISNTNVNDINVVLIGPK